MAEGILRIAAVSLAGAIKEVSVMRGIDPRDFALFPSAAPARCTPSRSPTSSACARSWFRRCPATSRRLGLLIADVRRDFVRTRVSQTAETIVAEVRGALRELRDDGEDELGAAGFAPERCRFAASLDMRYAGQSFELSVPVALDVASIDGDRARIQRGLRGALWRARRRARSRS